MPKLFSLQASDFSGQMDAKTQPLLLADNQLVRAVNCDFETLGAVKKRLGYVQQGSALTEEVLGFGVLSKANSTLKAVVVAGTDAYVYDESTGLWTAQSQSLTSGLKAEFRTFLDMLFMCNYRDATRTYDGSSWSTATNVTDAPKAKYVETFLSRVYLANCTFVASSYPSRVYYSSLPSDNAITWNVTENTGDYLEIDTDDNDTIKGMIADPSRLLIFKEFSLHSWDGYERTPILGAPGSTCYRSIVRIGGIVYYFNSEGVWGFDGAQSVLLSKAIDPYVKGVADPYNICAGTRDQHYILYVGDVDNSDEDISIDKVIFDYNTLTGRWKIDTLQHRPRVWLTCPIEVFE